MLLLMMFLQYMMLPVWFVPMLPYVQAMPGGSEWTVWCGFIMGFGTFIVGSQMHENEIVPADLRGQAQGFLNIITAGVGVFVSNGVFHAILGKAVPHAWTLAYAVALTLSLAGVAFASRAWSSPSAPGSRP